MSIRWSTNREREIRMQLVRVARRYGLELDPKEIVLEPRHELVSEAQREQRR
jgi:hypothetical protein